MEVKEEKGEKGGEKRKGGKEERWGNMREVSGYYGSSVPSS